MLDLRVPFIDTLIELAARDPKICIIVPDVGFMHATRFGELYPKQYFNFGITENTVVIAAANMALKGLKPWVFSMRNFVLYRPYEAVRNAVVFHKANVKLVGVSGAGRYGFLGRSHNDAYKGEHIKTAETLRLRVRLPKTAEQVEDIVRKENRCKTAAYISL